MRILLRILGWASAIILLVLLYLAFIGLPGSFIASWVEGRLGEGVSVECARVRAMPLRGVVMKELSITTPSETDPFRFDAEELILSIGKIQREAGHVGQVAFHLTSGSLRRGEVASVPLPHLTGYVERQGDTLTLPQFEGLTGTAAEQEPVRGSLVIDFETRSYEASIKSACRPSLFAELMPTNLAATVASLHFENPPLTVFKASGVLGEPEKLVVHGRMFSDRFQRNGIDVDLLHANVHFENGILRFDDMLAVRPEGNFRGTVQQDFAGKAITISGQGDANPLAIARVIQPKFEAWVEPYLQPLPTEIDGEVNISYLTNTHIEIHANVSGPELGYGPIVTDHGSARVDLSGKTIKVTELDGVWCDGQLTGSVLSDVEGEQTNRFINLDLELTNADLADIVALFRKEMNPDAYVGKVTIKANVQAQTTAFLDTLDGSGSMQIRNATLFSTRIGRGLSVFLSKLHPALGPKSIQRVDANFRLEGKALTFQKCDLRGRFTTITVSGTIGLDGPLNLRVRVKFLHEGLTARAIQLITLPATKLLEFECTGTLSEPRWKAVNAPKNILNIFRRKEPGTTVEEETRAKASDAPTDNP